MPSPNPNWKPGDKITPPFTEMAEVDPSKISQQDMYKLLIGAVVPRPIAFVSTVNNKGEGNLAPFSFFNAVCSNPPCLMIAVSRKPGGEKKDTQRNIEETGQYVINTVNEWIAEPAVHCAAIYPYGVNEMEKVGLTPINSIRVKPPRVKESAIQFECELYKIVDIGDGSPGSTSVIFGRVLLVHIDKKAYQKGRVLFHEIKNIGRLGGFGYGRITETFEIPVPEV